MKPDYLQKILTARVYDVAIESPLEPAPLLSARLGNKVLLKREDLQPTHSFKIRGAYNKMVNLPSKQLARGVIAASAGNHAQGVALAAQKLGVAATIVMPVTTPQIKIAAVKARGARVVLTGDSFDEAFAHAQHLQRRAKLVFVHPYDDPDVIAGQGTIGVELLRQRRGPLHAVFVAIGGGGLIAGIGTYLKRLRPEIKVIGVEPHDAASMYRSLKAGRRVPLAHVGLFADGVAVKQVGAETFRLCRDCVDEIILADTDEICAAVKDVYDDCRSILEPAGALAVAGLKKYAQRAGVRDQTLAAVTCGANMNFDRLRFIAERAELGEQREGIVAVTIPERPGSFRAFCRLIGRRNITEFNYRYAGEREAHVFVGVEVQTRSDIAELITRLRRAGLATLDLSGDEVAKLHVRHLVGGRAPQAKHETLYRFEFPERPGALMKFLDSMGAGWNITLFHYRNHGADYGRVLIGLQVPPSEKTAFRRFLKQLGYPYRDETDNPAYRLFLG
jgi:threonine dehydratase